MAKPTCSNRNAGPKKKKRGGNVETTEPRVEGDDDEAMSRNDLASRPAKTSLAPKKPTLTFEVKQAADSGSIWEGEVVEQGGELDSEYSIEDPDVETVLYDLDAIIGSQQSSVNRHQLDGDKDKLPLNWHKPVLVVLVSKDEEDYDNDEEETTLPAKPDLQAPEPMPGLQPGSSNTERPAMACTITPTSTGDSWPPHPKVDGALDGEMTEDKINGMRKAINEFIGDDTTMKKAVQHQLIAMGQAQRAVLSQITHTQTAKVFERLGFTNVDSKSNEYIRQYNAEILTVMLGRELGLTDETVKLEREADVNEWMMPSFEQQRINTEKTPTPEPSKQKKEPKPVIVKEELDEKLMTSNGRMTPSDIWELKNRYRANGSRSGNHIRQKNNAWLRPVAAAETASGEKPEDKEKRESNESGRSRGGPPSDDGSSGDESGDNDRWRDPFMPRPSS
ncbi:hypothetical protein ARMGADRAFT_1028257 [Armillaria gallica]|uniref:Uncharacterized protein n=1 Tax=Armillaria gallica TaxID=47427 RepID=A0A2H3DQ81_ARMGA|nr:hypothetical protein ARMGADRAFT_1028257 [Armillaria gallica]